MARGLGAGVQGFRVKALEILSCKEPYREFKL